MIIINSKFEFLSTPSARRATKCCRCCCQYTSISIHALREEGDRWRWSAPPQRYNFYPRPPRGGRRVGHNRESVRRAFLSTPSARRATDRTFAFSIRYNISIHALREEGDVDSVIIIYRSVIFLSTPSARRATIATVKERWTTKYFYPRPPRGGRPFAGPLGAVVLCISIHALREEGDPRRHYEAGH